MSDFTVENGISLPSKRNTYPFATMSPETSFAIVGEAEARKVRNAAYQYAKKVNTLREEAIASGTAPEDALAPVKFALRKYAVREDGVKLYRLWRE